LKYRALPALGWQSVLRERLLKMSKKTKAILANKSISLETLVALLRSFDRKEGEFPEHEFEGQAVGRQMLFRLGFSQKELESVFGEKDFRESDLSFRRTFKRRLIHTSEA
jgi:hypothetical protein